VVGQQVQAATRGGATTDVRGALATTQAAGRATPATRTAVGSTSASSAVQQAVRTNNAAAGAAKGAGIAAVTAQGRGFTVNQPVNRASTASKNTAAAMQVRALRCHGVAAEHGATLEFDALTHVAAPGG
jgi:hypothetical protein